MSNIMSIKHKLTRTHIDTYIQYMKNSEKLDLAVQGRRSPECAVIAGDASWGDMS